MQPEQYQNQAPNQAPQLQQFIPPEQPPQLTQPPAPTNNNKLIIIGLLVALLIAIAVIAVLILGRNNESGSGGNSPGPNNPLQINQRNDARKRNTANVVMALSAWIANNPNKMSELKGVVYRDGSAQPPLTNLDYLSTVTEIVVIDGTAANNSINIHTKSSCVNSSASSESDIVKTSTSERHFAVVTQLETSGQFYCQDV